MHSLGLLWAMVGLLASCGATCHRVRVAETLPPAAFAGPPTLDDVVYAVNANSHRVQQLETVNASLSLPGALPTLQANLVMEQPRNLRLRGQLTGFTGPELDIGSNNEEFWFWAKRGTPRALYFARHAEFSHSAARSVMPVEPEWLFDALGLVRFDAGGIHTGPFPAGQGRLEVHSRIPTPQGDMTKATVIHETYGWVLEQQVRDPQGQLLAAARTSQYRFYPAEAVSMPHQIDIQFPPAQLTLRLDVQSYVINQPAGLADMWVRPNFEGYPPLDLAGSQPDMPAPGASYPGASMPAADGPLRAPPSPSSVYAVPRTSYRPRVRGMTTTR